MSWNLIEKPAVKAKSQVHLIISMPTKRGQPKVYIGVPTVLCGKFGFDACDSADVMAGGEDNVGMLWIKPHTEGRRKVKQRLNVVQIQIEPIKGMALKNNSEYLDYEPGPENVGIIIKLPSWFFGGAGDENPDDAPTSNRTAGEKPGSLAMDGNRVVLGNKEATFTKNESAVMEILVNRFGRIVSKESIHDALYQLDPNGGADLKIVDVMICKIRAKLETTKFPLTVLTHWGRGYELRNPVA